MILDKQIKIRVTRRNIDHYSHFFKGIQLKDEIEVDPSLHFTHFNNTLLNVKCDMCPTERNIKYYAYYKNINSCKKYPIYTCDKCSHIKLKEFNKENYGVEYYSQHPDRNDKVKKTSLKKYGAEHFSKTNMFKEKFSKTSLERFGFENPFMDSDRIKSIFKDKYGVEHPSQVEEFNNKVKKTNLERFGFESHLSSPGIRDKINETNLEKYGGHPMTDDNVKKKSEDTCMEKYGFKYSYQSPEVKAKANITNLEKYGNISVTKSEIVRKKYGIANHPDYLNYIDNSISLFKCDKGHNFEILFSHYQSRTKNKIPLCTICNPIGSSSSIKELDVFAYIKSIYNNTIISSYRDGLEIDIYLPELKIGFEFNGLYWHSEEYKDKSYHLDKTKYFLDRGIRIIHIWEDDWDLKSVIIKSQISNWISGSVKIYARKCKVAEINDVKIVRNFLDNNHIQGYVSNIKCYGLYSDSELVSLMTFDRSEGRNKMEDGGWNLSRFCNKIGYSVIGGASKLFKYFLNDVNPLRVVSYADRDWSIGGLYNTLGFNMVSESKPDYKYLVDNKRVNKSRFRKSKLNTNLSESKYMESIGISRIWDCGKIKFEYINKLHN